jgi:hypothetical protein
MPTPPRYILDRVGVGSSQPNEAAFTLLVRKRLDQLEPMCSAPARDEAFVDARSQLAASLEKMNAPPVQIHGAEQSTPGWLETRAAQRSLLSAARNSLHRRPAFIANATWGYTHSAVAVAAVSGAMIGLAGYAVSFHGGSGGAVVDPSPLLRRPGLEYTSTTPLPAPAMRVAALSVSYDPKPAGPLYDEWNEPLVAKPESLAKPPETLTPKAAPALPDSGASGTVIPRPASRTLNKALEDTMLQRASRQASLGDIAGARSIFMSLAYQGSERAAFGLAETYEERFLRAHHVIGMKPEPNMAREWFEKAASLGSEDAVWRLRSLKQEE